MFSAIRENCFRSLTLSPLVWGEMCAFEFLGLDAGCPSLGVMWSVVRLSFIRLRGREAGSNIFTSTQSFFRTCVFVGGGERLASAMRQTNPSSQNCADFSVGRVTGDLFQNLVGSPVLPPKECLDPFFSKNKCGLPSLLFLSCAVCIYPSAPP